MISYYEINIFYYRFKYIAFYFLICLSSPSEAPNFLLQTSFAPNTSISLLFLRSLALLGLILSPSCSKMARSCGNIAQHRAKIRQRGLQKHSHEPQRPLKVVYSHRFLGFRRFGRKFKVSQQDASKSAPSRHSKTTQRLATFKLASPQNLLQVRSTVSILPITQDPNLSKLSRT